MNRLRLFATLSTLLVALLLTACGNNAEPSDPGAIPTVTGLPAGEQQAAPETDAPAEGYPSPETAPEAPAESEEAPESYPEPEQMELPSPTPFPPDYVAPTPIP